MTLAQWSKYALALRDQAFTRLASSSLRPNDEINVTGFKVKPVGYRWPTKFNHLLATTSRMARAAQIRIS